jgi:tetratricopeptide (TPR) repeat protein
MIRHIWTRCLSVAIIGLLITLISTPAFSDNLDDAKQAVNRAVELYQQGKFKDALPLAEKANSILEKEFGPDHEAAASTQTLLGHIYNALGDYPKAEPMYRKALDIYRNTAGPDSLATAAAMNNLGALYYHQGRYDLAEPLYKDALRIREKALGPDHPDVAVCINNLAALYDAQGRYAEAAPLYERSLVIREKALGPDHPLVAIALNNLAALYDSMGRYAEAEPLYLRALAIREKALGPDHPLVAESLNNLAFLYDTLGDYGKAAPMYKRALELRKASLGPDHQLTAVSLNNLAEFHRAFGELDQALALQKEALRIREKALGPKHPDVAQSLNNMALTLQSKGDLASAEPLLEKATEISKNAVGTDHPLTASCLNNLAELYREMGDPDRAQPLYEQALAIRERVFGDNHPAVAVSLNNLAGYHQSQHDYEKAETLLTRALGIWQSTLGPEHPTTAAALNNLAGLYFERGFWARAEVLDRRALEIRKKAFGPDHIEVAQSLNNLAGFYLATGNPRRAESYYQQAIDIVRRSMGTDHPDLTNTMGNMAVLYAGIKRHRKSDAVFREMETLTAATIDQVLGFTSEDRKLKYLAVKRRGLYAHFSLVINHLLQDPAARLGIFEAWLRRKGIVLQAQRRFQEALFYKGAPEARKAFQELARLRAAYSRMVYGGPGKMDPTEYKKRLEEIKSRIRDQEALLSRLSSEFEYSRKAQAITSSQAAAALPPGSALLEFAWYEPFDFKERRFLPPRYLAFVLGAGRATPDIVDLGPADKIDNTLQHLKQQISILSESGQKDAHEYSRRLHDLVFAPIKKRLGRIRRVYVSPDGNLNVIPFEILVDPKGKFLIDNYTFNYLSTGRDVLELKSRPQSGKSGGPVILMGDPNFDMDLKQKNNTLRGLGLETRSMEKDNGETGDTEGLVESSSLQVRDLTFTPLSGTRDEVLAIQKILGSKNVQVYLGDQVLEEVLRQDPAPSILHLATHGFFLADLVVRPPRDRNTLASGDTDKSTRGIKILNPLLRSGLALAGANSSASDNRREDGILTAEKVLGMQLKGTQLVVLSACETGLGEVKIGEGIYGLRRAFNQAGANALVMSMWGVPDLETKELMVRFYEYLKENRYDGAECLRQAMLDEKKVVEKRYGHASPLYWGAFVYLGRP